MNRRYAHIKYWPAWFFIIAGFDCRQPYTPPVIAANVNYLVVDGYINVAQDTTTITLSRTKNVNDTSGIKKEPGAMVVVQCDDGSTYPLIEEGNGIYQIPYIAGSPSANYRLSIKTSDNQQYMSDYVPFKKTPPIDSLDFAYLYDGVHIYVNTHDPTNKTRNYRWDYVETWGYHSTYSSTWMWVNDALVQRPDSLQISLCWSVAPSTNINITSTDKLAQDIVHNNQLEVIPMNDAKLSVEYSMLLSQYALTDDAFSYWQLVSSTNQNLGSIFDAQPTQVTGNIHCTTNPKQVVVGYISASTREQKRYFINRSQIGSWVYPQLPNGCDTMHQQPGISLVTYFDGFHDIPIDTTGGLYFSTPYCVDCRTQGGGTKKPAYMP